MRERREKKKERSNARGVDILHWAHGVRGVPRYVSIPQRECERNTHIYIYIVHPLFFFLFFRLEEEDAFYLPAKGGIALSGVREREDPVRKKRKEKQSTARGVFERMIAETGDTLIRDRLYTFGIRRRDQKKS